MSVAFNQWTPVASCGGAPTVIDVTIERLAIAVANVLPPLANTPTGAMFLLVVNGTVFTPVDLNPAFSLSGAIVTWTSSLYSVGPADNVVAIYNYLRPTGA
jgi:hypothetical protein